MRYKRFPAAVRRAISACLILALMFNTCLLVGCSGGSQSTPPQEIPVAQRTGTINHQELPGDGLHVVSAWQSDAPVNEAGEFTTMVSEMGAQLLFLQDAAGQKRALAISVPATRVRAAAPLSFNARNTALTLSFITPGIISTDPQEAQDRLNKLAALPSFPAFETYLRTQLLATPLETVLNQPEYSEKLTACLNEWRDLYAAPYVSYSRDVHPSLDTKGQIHVMLTDKSNIATTKLDIQNFGFRQMTVARVDRHANGDLLGTTKVGTVDGATGASWGSLLTDRFMKPSTLGDSVNFLWAASSEYWAVGIGFGTGGDAPTTPLPITADDQCAAAGSTILFYAVFPIVDLALGGASLLNKGWHAADLAYGALEGGMNIQSLLDANGPAEVTASLIEITKVLLSSMGTIGSVLAANGIISAKAAAAMELLGPALAASSATIAIGNIVLVGRDWITLPPAVMLGVRTSGAGEVTIDWGDE